MAEPHEIRSASTSGLRWLTGLAIGFTMFMVFLAVGCLLGLMTQDLDGPTTISAVFVGGLGVFGALAGMRGVRALRSASTPTVLARLDDDGLHLHEGMGIPDVPEQLAWTTIPWGWITSVAQVRFDLAASKKLGADMPLDCLRFTLADDDLLPTSPIESPVHPILAGWLGLTPRQARTVLVAEADQGRDGEHQRALEWLRRNRPELPVLSGPTAPWSTRASEDRWSSSPRVAVTGAHGRLGRQVVEAVTAREDAPPVALVRNEAHRAALERLGAEVRMVDLEDQDPAVIAQALRGCAAVVHASTSAPEPVVAAARRAGVQRLITVPGVWNGEQQVAAAADSGLAWTSFRPSALTDQPPSGEVDLGLDVTPGPVPRADLAAVIAASIRDEDSVGEAWPITGVRSSAS
ncbi:NAD(P)H-binding protein [Nocardioides sp. GXZ039]|uniref:NAD(P)H-binding protein n=1 Tax=Nocardioides sp. GXZ039 TaxID=3136018 RepID=UPI0030F45733